eukprot:54731-Rhodomonas_salina.2
MPYASSTPCYAPRSYPPTLPTSTLSNAPRYQPLRMPGSRQPSRGCPERGLWLRFGRGARRRVARPSAGQRRDG